MLGFYTLRRFLKEIYAREDKYGKLNIPNAKSVDPKFKSHVMEKLNLDDEDFKGLVGALFYFDLVSKGRVRRFDEPRQLRDRIVNHREFRETVESLSKAGFYFYRIRSYDVPNSLSFTGHVMRELARKVVKKPRNVIVTQALANVVIGIASSFVPFVLIPAQSPPMKGFPMEIYSLIVSLEELGGIATVQELYDRAVAADRIGNPDEFFYGVSLGVVIQEIFRLTPSKKSRHALVAMARRIRAGEDYEDTTPQRVYEFVNRIKGNNLLGPFKALEFNEKIIDKEILEIIDESIARDAEEFLSAYGDVRIEFAQMDNIKKSFTVRR